VCPMHLKDTKFCTPYVDHEAEAERKKKEQDDEIARLKKEYEEKQRKKKQQEKEKDKEKKDEDKDKEKDKSDDKADGEKEKAKPEDVVRLSDFTSAGLVHYLMSNTGPETGGTTSGTKSVRVT
jgi:FKBP-type peptidyl-prolyl cis-trans isomerase